jgi:hypothetical protein
VGYVPKRLSMCCASLSLCKKVFDCPRKCSMACGFGVVCLLRNIGGNLFSPKQTRLVLPKELIIY